MRKFQLTRHDVAIAEGIERDDGSCELEFLGGFPRGKRTYPSLKELLQQNTEVRGLTQFVEL